MQGDPDVLAPAQRTIDQRAYLLSTNTFLHSKMVDNWGFTELAAHTRAGRSTKCGARRGNHRSHLLLLDGLPNYQRIGSLRIGQEAREQFTPIWRSNTTCWNRLKPGIVKVPGEIGHRQLPRKSGCRRGRTHRLETQLELMDKLESELTRRSASLRHRT